MKTLIRIPAFISIIMLLSSCLTGKKIAEANTVVLPLSDTVTIRDGSIIYGLPRTVFMVTVRIERTIEKPGPYAKFANDLLGIDNAILNESESWTIENVSVNVNEELDPSEFFIIRSNTHFETNVLALKKEGIILDINPAIYYKNDNLSLVTGSDKGWSGSFDLGSDEYFQVQRDTAYKRVAVDSSFIRIPYAVEKKKRLTVEQLAEKAAKRVMDLRDGKLLILTGEATVFPQNDAAIKEINRIEKEYTELFTGKILKETRTFSYQIVPDKKMTGNKLTIFRFSELTGPTDALSKGGVPVTVEFTPEQKTKSITFINKNQVETEPKFDKLYYRVPDVVNVKIGLNSEVLYNSRKLIYQFGEIVKLPSNYIIGR
jgi:hypothetical protein